LTPPAGSGQAPESPLPQVNRLSPVLCWAMFRQKAWAQGSCVQWATAVGPLACLRCAGHVHMAARATVGAHATPWVHAQELLKRLEAFVGAHCPAGLKWNAAGGPITAARTHTPAPLSAGTQPSTSNPPRCVRCCLRPHGH